MEGTIPSSFSELRSIEVLDLGGNNLEGTIPSSFSELKNIKVLKLRENNLEGTIPSSFSELKSIEYLDLGGNNLSGMLEFDMFLTFKSFTLLDLRSNNLTLLTKANSNGTLHQFESLNLGSCNLRKFPDFLRNQNKLLLLDLSHNNLEGLIPKWFYNVSIESLEFISLSDNFLVGFEQSPMVLPWSKLSSLDLGNNSLQGSLPIPPPSTRIYRVQRNFIREMSPLLICNQSSLEVLDLSYNNLSDMLPPCLGNFSSPLLVLQLRSNNFHGTIPKTWSKESGLKMIDLTENQLQGQVPRSMANCTMLEYLNVGNNQINDLFPFWLGTLSRLKVLVLRSNAFHGAITSPQTNYTFFELHIIDLSQNSFSRNLPAKYFLHWNAMKVVGANQLIYMVLHITSKDGPFDGTVLCTVTVTNKGINLKYDKTQYVFTVIDFSSNKFEGEIPEFLRTLKGLHLLNLSNNALTGYIPPTLGNLTNIKSMDLSKNKLFGEIPPQLTQLFSLEYFNVSNNCLTGPIPYGNQFDTFPNSSFGDNQSSESPFEFGWKVVAIGYGCRFVIGIVIGQIVIDIYIGAGESSATTLEWAMAELIRNPRVMAKAQAEVRQVLIGKKKLEGKDMQQLDFVKYDHRNFKITSSCSFTNKKSQGKM
ncbi:receptor like protein 22-like [Corylus avellana]|uniref:receptor like protein 22-like n=1 Tax=Corylus avellana TaxID=13451 RepID=UPI00286D04A8|nr:receptor like protein 22-like [Corylus avellana]